MSIFSSMSRFASVAVFFLLLFSYYLKAGVVSKMPVYLGNPLINRLTEPYSAEPLAYELLPEAHFIVHSLADASRTDSSPAYIDNSKEQKKVVDWSASRGESVIVLIDPTGRVARFWVRTSEYLRPTELSPEVLNTYQAMLSVLKFFPARINREKVSMLTIL